MDVLYLMLCYVTLRYVTLRYVMLCYVMFICSFLFVCFSFFSSLLSHFLCSRTFKFLKNMRLWMASWITTLKLWAKNPIRSLGICLWNLNSWGKLHIHRAVTEKYPRVIMQILTLWLANDRFQAITVKGMAHYAVISKLTCTNQTSTVNQNARK